MESRDDLIAKYGHPGAIPRAAEIVPADRWDNTIREWGVVFACEWFGYHSRSDFTAETITTLIQRSEESPEKPA